MESAWIPPKPKPDPTPHSEPPESLFISPYLQLRILIKECSKPQNRQRHTANDYLWIPCNPHKYDPYSQGNSHQVQLPSFTHLKNLHTYRKIVICALATSCAESIKCLSRACSRKCICIRFCVATAATTRIAKQSEYVTARCDRGSPPPDTLILHQLPVQKSGQLLYYNCSI